MSANETLGTNQYRCTRGCGEVIGHPANQDQHNFDKHYQAWRHEPHFAGGMSPAEDTMRERDED